MKKSAIKRDDWAAYEHAREVNNDVRKRLRAGADGNGAKLSADGRTKQHRTLKTFAPGVRILRTKAYRSLVRMQEHRKRLKEHRRDPIQFRRIGLPKSVITKIESELIQCQH